MGVQSRRSRRRTGVTGATGPREIPRVSLLLHVCSLYGPARTADERQCDAQLAPLPAAQLARGPVALLRQSDFLHFTLHFGRHLAGRHPVRGGKELQVLAHLRITWTRGNTVYSGVRRCPTPMRWK